MQLKLQTFTRHKSNLRSIPVRAWVWTSIITFGSVLFKQIPTHIYLPNLLISGCHIFWLMHHDAEKRNYIETRCNSNSRPLRDTGKSCGQPAWGLGCGLDHRVPSCSNESRHICVFTLISSAVAATHRRLIYYNVDTGQTCGLVQTHCVMFHVKVQEILQQQTGGHAASKPNTSMIADISWRAHSNGAHTSPCFAMEMRCICVWWHLWLGVILRRFLHKLPAAASHLRLKCGELGGRMSLSVVS